MREIIFRGLDKNGKWIEGDLSRRKSRFAPQLDTVYGIADENGEFKVVDPDTVGQFTGIKDINGNRIFEGDIITVFPFEETYRFAVRYDELLCGFYAGVSTVSKIMEVVGNIYTQK